MRLAILLTIVIGLVALAWSAPRAHDWYSGQYSKHSRKQGGLSCCNQRVDHPNGYSGDCKPVRARMRGSRWFFDYDGREYAVPDDAIMPDGTSGAPLEAHGCVNNGRVLCFWRRATGS